MEYLFILGSHRTGSKLLASFFEEKIPKVKSVHQYSQLQYNNIWTNMYLTGFFSKNKYENLVLSKWLNPLLAKEKKAQPYELYVESNGFNYHAAYIAKQTVPQKKIKIIHVVRDPRDSIVSHLNWIAGRTKSKVANYCIPFWNLNGKYQQKMGWINWQRKSMLEKLAYNWKWKNELIEELYSKNREDYLFIRFEDLIDKSLRVNTLAKMADFLDINFPVGVATYFDTKQNSSKRIYFREWEDWDSQQKMFLQEICGDLMTRYNYQ